MHVAALAVRARRVSRALSLCAAVYCCIVLVFLRCTFVSWIFADSQDCTTARGINMHIALWQVASFARAVKPVVAVPTRAPS